jgi:tetratricopeptide (TPR) repeat protein
VLHEVGENTEAAAGAAQGDPAQAPGQGNPDSVFGGNLPSADEPLLSGAVRPETRAIARKATPEEITSLLRIGLSKRDAGDYDSAELAFLQVLAERATREQDRDALLGLGRTYRKKGDFTKAAAVMERFAKTYPADPELPLVFLELGRTFRALGAHKQAIARFYSVLNTTLKLPDEGADTYRQLARTAQFEIAETYFQSGDFGQATRFFSRLKLLDLAPEDRARAHFKSAYALTLGGENEKAVSTLRSFLEQNPEDENVPEARYLLSVVLRRLGHLQESLSATVGLLKEESHRVNKDARRWAYWQRRTGNQLANEFYQSGDISSALVIYQHLAALSTDATWQLPVTYQIGLCYERLRQPERARDAYQSIVDKLKAATADGAPRPELADLAEMAAWRLGQLTWQSMTEAQVSAMFPNPSPASPPGPTPVSSASDHDHHGSSPIASQFVR